ncbi:MAG: type II toxin-antitoxin system HicA family toxin, partial [Verrucomicrobia bacterium]|nr:type II toxin-antitoxin system HicA family toxin [Verrucomicrobiota bacterium]
KKHKKASSFAAKQALAGGSSSSNPSSLSGKASEGLASSPVRRIAEKTLGIDKTSASIEKSIASLKLPENSIDSLETADPEVFFDNINVSISPAITSHDIVQLQDLFKKHKLSKEICFHDLFGLEFYDILSNAFLHEEERQALINEWAALYLSGYLGIFRSHNPINNETNIYFRLSPKYLEKLGEFRGELNQAMQSHVEEFKSKGLLKKSDKIKETNQKIAKTEEEWIRIQALLAKLINNDPNSLILTASVSKCPGSAVMDPVSKEEIPLVLNNLAHYCSIMHRSHEEAARRGVCKYKGELFGEIQKRIVGLSQCRTNKEKTWALQEILTDIESYADFYRENLHITKNSLLAAENNTLTHEEWCQAKNLQVTKVKPQKEFIEFLIHNHEVEILNMEWLRDITLVIEHEILPKLDPSFNVPAAYYNRIVVNLEGMRLDQEENPITQVEQVFEDLKTKFKAVFDSEEMKNELGDLNEIVDKCGFLKTYLNTHLQNIYELVKPSVDDALQRIFEVTKEDCGDISLTEKTLWLSRILILVNDLEVLLKKKDQTEDILPKEFLDFLSLNENKLLEPDTLESAPVEEISEKPLNQPTPLASASEEEVIEKPIKGKLRKATSSQKAKTVEIKEKAKAPRGEAMLSEQEELANEILRTRKRTRVEAILTKLGFEKIRVTGGHATWKHETGAQTTVAQHGAE